MMSGYARLSSDCDIDFMEESYLHEKKAFDRGSLQWNLLQRPALDLRVLNTTLKWKSSEVREIENKYDFIPDEETPIWVVCALAIGILATMLIAGHIIIKWIRNRVVSGKFQLFRRGGGLERHSPVVLSQLPDASVSGSLHTIVEELQDEENTPTDVVASVQEGEMYSYDPERGVAVRPLARVALRDPVVPEATPVRMARLLSRF